MRRLWKKSSDATVQYYPWALQLPKHSGDDRWKKRRQLSRRKLFIDETQCLGERNSMHGTVQ
jgi:hypothetical protein